MMRDRDMLRIVAVAGIVGCATVTVLGFGSGLSGSSSGGGFGLTAELRIDGFAAAIAIGTPPSRGLLR